MAWRDTIRRPQARATVFSDLTFSTRVVNYSSSRILSVDITEEVPAIAIPRRVSECSLRITNDFAEDESMGGMVPALSAGGSEDLAGLIGMVLRIYIWEGTDTSATWTSTYIIDGVEATDDGGTIRGFGVESLLDKTFEEVGLSPSISTSDTAMTWMLDAMAACGYRRASIRYPPDLDPAFPRPYTVDKTTPVGDVVRGVAAYLGLTVGMTDSGARGAILPPGSTSVEYGLFDYLPRTTFAEPVQTDTYGSLIIRDPTNGTSRTMDLNNGMTGVMEIEIPYSSDLTDMSFRSPLWMIKDELGRRLGAWHRVDLVGDPELLHANVYFDEVLDGPVNGEPAVVLKTKQISEYGYMSTAIDAWRIEHHYDGGFRQSVSGSYTT